MPVTAPRSVRLTHDRVADDVAVEIYDGERWVDAGRLICEVGESHPRVHVHAGRRSTHDSYQGAVDHLLIWSDELLRGGAA